MASQPQSPQVVRFGLFEVDLRTRELRKGGLKLKVHEQTLQLLGALIERPGEVVTREELRQKLWPGDTFVDFDQGINTAIKKLREALGDSAENPRFVETLARRGYRFLAPVDALASTALVARQPTQTGSVIDSEASGVGTVRELLASPASGRVSQLLGAVSAIVANGGRNHAHLAWPALAAVVAAIAIVLAFLHFREKPVETQAVRFSVFPPEKADFSDALAISPDGTRLALIVSTAGKGPSLWVRRLDSLAVQPLAGTEGADEPFWSPDGRFIAFFAQGKLRKVEAAGGPTQTLCEAPGGTGGSWNRDGVIIFGLHHVLYRVPAEGGQPTSITALDETRHEFEHLGPHFLPDERHFLYLAVGRKRGMGNDGIYIGSLDAKENKRLMDSHWRVAFALLPGGRDGHVLFVRDGTLMAQRFDPEQLRLVGRPVPLAEDINLDQDDPVSFSVSANGTLAYLPNGQVKTQLVWFDRMGRKLGMVGREPGQDERPSLSPDGKQVAIERVDPQSGNRNIWQLDLLRGAATRLTFVPAVDRSPVWSPDGGHIVFASYRDGAFSLYQKAASGLGNEELLLTSDEYKVPNDWSRDGRFLIYGNVNTKTGYDLWIFPFHGDRKAFPFLQTQFNEAAARLSPDGKWIAYQSDESGRWEVYVQPFGGGPRDGDQAHAAPRGKWRISTESGVHPKWRDDGKELFYMTQGQGKIRAVAVKAEASKDQPTFEPSVPEPLFDLPPNHGLSPFAVTADGQRFLVNTIIGEEKSTSVTVVLNWPALLKR